MNTGQNRGGGGFCQDEFWFGGDGSQIQRPSLKFDFFPLQKKDGESAKTEKSSRNHGELIAGAHINGSNRRQPRHMNENEQHQGIKNSCRQRTDEKCEGMIDAGVTSAFEAKTIFDVTLRPRKQIRITCCAIGRFF